MHYLSANLVRSYKDSDLFLVVTIAPPAKGSLIDQMTTRHVVGVPPEMIWEVLEGIWVLGQES